MCKNSATKNVTIREKYQKSQTKIVLFYKSSKIQQQKRYHSSSVKNFENQNMVPFEQSAKNLKQKWYHLKKCENFGTKKVPIEEFAKIRQQKWNH